MLLGTSVPPAQGMQGIWIPPPACGATTTTMSLLLHAHQNPREFDLLNYTLASVEELKHPVNSLMPPLEE